MPTLKNALETLQEKIRRYGPEAHCTRIIVSEESRAKAIKNEPDEDGKRRTIISFQTYSPEAYSNWHAAFGYLMERCAFNPIMCVDLLLLMIQEARMQHCVTEDPNGGGPREVDGIDVALHGLWSVNGDYESKLREAKSEYRARRKKAPTGA